jgi:hypothetical protein
VDVSIGWSMVELRGAVSSCWSRTRRLLAVQSDVAFEYPRNRHALATIEGAHGNLSGTRATRSMRRLFKPVCDFNLSS